MALADGIPMGVATGSEFRTAPLWGLRHHAPYLHNGSADTIDDAIRMHDGEANDPKSDIGGQGVGVRDAYVDLPAGDRAAIIAFLETR